MTEINASPGRILQIGYESEDSVTNVIFHYDEEWLLYGAGEFKIRVKRPCDTEAYNAMQVVDDRETMTLTMTVTDVELSVKGHGEMQIIYIGSDFVKKSPIYRYNVSRAIDSEVVNPPQGSVINEILYDIGNLDELTTNDKSSLVSAINEVYQQGGGGSITVDDELSGISENPVQNKVVKLRFDGLEQILVDKASKDVATQSANGLMSAQDKTKLDGLGNSGVSDVQVNGTSVVTDGVAKIPIATGSINGVVKVDESGTYGIKKWSNTHALLVINSATSSFIKNPNSGTADFRPLTPNRQHEATFYGLAKAAGDTTQSASSNAVGTYTEEAKTAIRTMLGIEDMYQWYKNNSGN